MSWWAKQKILKIILYTLWAIVFVNGILFEICPTIYPEWLRNGFVFAGLLIMIGFVIWRIVYLIIKCKN